ncbi:MAG: 30S ribosomal protein S17 [Candidatus Tectimicrobiota bacterium]
MADGRRKVLFGEVVSDKMEKTITVRVERRVRHPIYERVVKRSKKFHAHDEHNQCRVGDMVRIIETRPLSKTKCWRLLEVVRRPAMIESSTPVGQGRTKS